MRMRILQPFIVLPAIVLIVSFPVAAAIAASPIYRCELNGITTFSDRPCAADSSEYVPNDQRVSTVKVEHAAPATQARGYRGKFGAGRGFGGAAGHVPAST